jgi:hypothetical protein
VWRPASSAVSTPEDPSTAAPMDITIDPASTHSKTAEGNAGGNVAEAGEV